jgi:S1-C subfamily serine protease
MQPRARYGCMLMRTLTWHRAAWLAVLLFGVTLLVACEQAARLIPDATPTPAPNEATGETPVPTPIVVNPSMGSEGGAPAQVIADHELALSVVQVIVVDNSAGFEQIVRYGSGVVVDAGAGLIATSYPVVHPYRTDGSRAYSSIIIAVNRLPGTEPQREFVAELAAAEPQLGLAVLRVTGQSNGQPLAGAGIDLPEVLLGDPYAVGAGFSLRLFGYPGAQPGAAGSSQVQETAQATVVGQRGTVGHPGRVWLKVDSRMPFGAAGGPAFDRFGSLVGILAQDRYVPAGVVAQVRPLDLLTPVVERAQRGSGPYTPPLHRQALLPGSLSPAPAGSTYVSRPAFAENALETSSGRDLFDYEARFTAGLGALYYEYEVNGLPDGTIVEERWFLNDLQQESLSSSFVWSQGAFGYVHDRITAPSPAGIPSGNWRLDVYVAGTLHATATAIVGVALPTPSATFQFAASAATAEGNIASGAFVTAPRLLMMFDVTGMSGANTVEWHIFRDNQPVYISEAIPWIYGDSGRFWVGYAPPGGITAGTWEVELHAGGAIVGVGTVSIP